MQTCYPRSRKKYHLPESQTVPVSDKQAREMKVGGEALKNVGSAEQSLASAQESGVPQGAPA